MMPVGRRNISGQANYRTASYWNFEYKSDASLFGWPLIHIAQGLDPGTGLPRIAKGVIAIGNIAFGGLAVGLLAAGGGLAIAGFLAIGGANFSPAYAVGGLALAPHFLGGNGIDPAFLRWVEPYIPQSSIQK